MSKLTFEEGLSRLHKLLMQESENESTSSDSSDDKDSGNEYRMRPPFDGQDNSVFSLVAANGEDKESVITSQLVKVRLSDEEQKEYLRFFYPKSPGAFLPVVDQLAKLSARTSGFFALLRFCLKDARRLAAKSQEERIQIVNDQAERLFKNVVGMDTSSIVDNFLTTMSSGTNHTITPSKRYSGGYDIQYIGGPMAASNPTDPLPSVHVPYGDYSIIANAPEGKSNSTQYEYEYLEAYATELSQACVKAGEEMLSLILGEDSTSYKKASSRIVKTLPLNFDFRQFNDIFFKHTRIALSVEFMDNVSSDIAKEFGDYISVNALRTPKADSVDKVSRAMRRRKMEAGEDGTAAPLAPDFLEDFLTKEGLALSQTVSYAFSITLPENIARYIAQSEETEDLSMLSLHNWVSIWTKRYVRKKNSKTAGGAVKRGAMPKFVLPLSKAQKASEIRAENGFHMEEGKGDENNVFIAPNGSLQYALPANQRDQIQENLDGYERDMEEYLKFCFDNGIPAQGLRTLPTEVIINSDNPNIESEFKELIDRVQSYSGKVLSYDWDYNNVITANVQSPTSIVPQDMVGAAKVDALTTADYLGFNFANSGEEPIRKSFADSMVLMTNTKLGKNDTSSMYGGGPQSLAQFMAPSVNGEGGGVAPSLLPFYRYCAAKERVPGIQELIQLAAKELGITELDEAETAIHNGIIQPNLEPGLRFQGERANANSISYFLGSVLEVVMRYASGSYLMRQRIANENPGTSPQDIESLVLDDSDYFMPNKSPAADFGRLYNHLGGMIFKIAMEKLTQVSPKDLFSIELPLVVNGVSTPKPSYKEISREVMPLAVMFSKYIPNAEQTFREAEEAIEANSPDESIDEQDIKISGAQDGAQMFPHQVKAHQSLRKRPKYSIMDIAPGGGKTSLGVTDIGAMVKELAEIGGERIRPLILCPDGLIKNWVDDMKIFTGSKWNMIPVNRHVIKRWGYERLEEMIRDAPVNTVVVAGFNFLKSNVETVVFGTHSAKVSNNLEFMKRFGFDYICIDESHKLKNKKTLLHKTVKQLTTASQVRFVRLATGTLISNRVDDIIGQASLFNGHIFREGEIDSSATLQKTMERLEEERKAEAEGRPIDSSKVKDGLRMNGDDIPLWEVDSPQRARQKLGRYSSVITMKKKEWAFMLPSPIETFWPIPMVPSGNSGASEEEIYQGELHKQLYDAVIKDSLEELEDLLEKAKARNKNRSEDDDDDGDDDDDERDDDDKLDVDLTEGEDELALLNDAQLTPHLARLERLISNPMADEMAPTVFGAAGVENYHSTKARFVAKRIDDHFNPEQWNKDKVYKEYNLVSYEDKLYLSRKLDKSTSKATFLPDSTRGVPPTEDTETWKEEAEGKVLVFCRFTNSVNGIYNALPDHYKRIAAKFTGEEDDKWGNLEGFVNDPKIKILVANEMGISEGHNLQMASRIIRIESPWAPGDLDQSASRIFRPDPKAQKDMVSNGKPGELAREAVFLDWVLCDNTMEVAKQARLIAKVFNKARFDEAENDTYDEVLRAHELDEIRMSLDTLRSRASLMGDFKPYVDAYAYLNGIQREEFHDMRVNMDHSMRNIEPQPEVEGSRQIQTPFVSSQKLADPYGMKPVTLKDYLRNEKHADKLANPDNLKGLPVITDQGNGQIAKVRPRYQKELIVDEDGIPVRSKSNKLMRKNKLDENGRPIVDPKRPIVSMQIKLSGSNEVITLTDAGVAYVPTKLSPENQKMFRVNNLNVTKSQQRKAEREARKESEAEEKRLAEERKEREKEEARELAKEARRRRKLKEEAEQRKAAAEDGKDRKKNLEEGKPINQGINRVKDVPPIQSGRVEDMSITLHPAYFHGYLTLEMKANDPDAKKLKKFGFKDTGPYAYVEVNRYNRFDKLLDYLEDNFELSNQSISRLEAIQDAFEEGIKGPYRMELAPSKTMPFFFAQRKRKVTKRKEVRPYPIILPDRLQIAVDLTTSPIIKNHIGKAVPGAVAKWQASDGHLLYFARSKSDLREKVKELKAAGFSIENMDELKAEVTNIKFRAPKGKK